jgi:hypothetical protein
MTKLRDPEYYMLRINIVRIDGLCLDASRMFKGVRKNWSHNGYAHSLEPKKSWYLGLGWVLKKKNPNPNPDPKKPRPRPKSRPKIPNCLGLNK